MEGREVGAQVAAPVFLHHQALPAQFHDPVKKRGFPWQNNTAGTVTHPSNPAGTWNMRNWDWDSVRFAARPSSDSPDALPLGAHPSAPSSESEQRKGAEERAKAVALHTSMELDGGEGLTLKLGGSVYSGEPVTVASTPATPAVTVAVAVAAGAAAGQEPMVRPNKRVRSGSPGSAAGGGGGGGGSYPMCQVDDCRADLSKAKDYHRRHKVCEVHSKTTKALVANQMQRFCQQCSRFHPLSEFDEGKRSCRRRLAGHNRRRRKTQPTDVASQLLLPSASQENGGSANLNLVNLLTVLLHGNNGDKSPSAPPVPDKDGLVQILAKINSLNGMDLPARSPASGGFDLNEGPNHDSPLENTANQAAGPSTMNLLSVFSAALAVSATTNKPMESHSQGSSDSSGINNDKRKSKSKQKSPSTEPPNDVNSRHQLVKEGSRPSLPLQLFGSNGDDSPPKMSSAGTKYLSSESSNPMEERSPSSSPPITRKFFPLHSSTEGTKQEFRAEEYSEDTVPVEASTSRGLCQPLDLFKDKYIRQEGAVALNVAYPPPCYASSSGSDHSPTSSNSDAQDQTGRIVFKLFGKDPGSFPQNLRDQIYSWLSNSPSEMESYIRPGCVVLSVYLSMPAFVWDQLEEKLLQKVTSLVGQSDFWKSGRFLVRTKNQLVSHKEGMIRLSKSWSTWGSPELRCVSPVAVVGGQSASLLLKGRNLTVPGTKIYCTYMGKYTSKEVLCSAYPGTLYDDSSFESFDLPIGGGPPLSLGRCFIEVENGFKGNSFPVIIASSPICQELRTLETELEGQQNIGPLDGVLEDNGRPRSTEDVLHFLNELGWLFQKYSHNARDLADFSVVRFKYLLTFSVERDWCTITKTLLDILAKRRTESEALSQESLAMLHEMHLLNRAVRRKCRRMVDLLLHFFILCPNNNDSENNNNNTTKYYLFTPNLAGPEGLTPLHLAASSLNSDQIVDALTDDPQQIGLRSWGTLLDGHKQTPKMYAESRNNNSYNELVAHKLVDRNNAQVSIMVGTDDEVSISTDGLRPLQIKAGGSSRTCAQCAMMETVLPRVGPTVCRRGVIARPYILSILGIAAVCVCVCVFTRVLLRINYGRSFKWETVDFGSM